MSKIADLEIATGRFFELHWPSTETHLSQPLWENWSTFLYKSVPNNKFGGCYALFEKGTLLYIGKGVSAKDGISKRLSSHVLGVKSYAENPGEHLSYLREKWSDVTEIWTIGFTKEWDYLAHALEVFLIRQLQPIKNKHS